MMNLRRWEGLHLLEGAGCQSSLLLQMQLSVDAQSKYALALASNFLYLFCTVSKFSVVVPLLATVSKVQTHSCPSSFFGLIHIVALSLDALCIYAYQFPIWTKKYKWCRILGISTSQLRENFDQEASHSIKQPSQYARNFLEYCCFRALALSTQVTGYLEDKRFRRLTFDMMLAWEFSAATSQVFHRLCFIYYIMNCMLENTLTVL